MIGTSHKAIVKQYCRLRYDYVAIWMICADIGDVLAGAVASVLRKNRHYGRTQSKKQTKISSEAATESMAQETIPGSVSQQRLASSSQPSEENWSAPESRREQSHAWIKRC